MEIMQAARSVLTKRLGRFELPVAVRSAAIISDRSSGETATFPVYTLILVSEMSTGIIYRPSSHALAAKTSAAACSNS